MTINKPEYTCRVIVISLNTYYMMFLKKSSFLDKIANNKKILLNLNFFWGGDIVKRLSLINKYCFNLVV